MDIINIEIAKKKSMPSELRAVIHIFSADDELRSKALSFVDVNKREVNWYGLSRHYFGSGHSSAIMWAKSIWSASQPKNSDLFERASSMDSNVRKSVLEALAISWGLL
jgi:hypothetical protein